MNPERCEVVTNDARACPPAFSHHRVSALEEPDDARLRAAWAWARECAGPGLARQVFPRGADQEAVCLVERHCRFAHVGTLLFPTSVNAVLAGLRRIGLDPPLPTRSQLVRSRLAERYGLSAQDMEVTLARLTCPDHAGVGLELFFFPRSARALTSWIVDNERHRELESHLAVRVLSPDQALLEQLLDAFRRQGLFLEGGGHLAGHGDEGSSTTLYFVTTGPAPGVPHRVELCCPGDFSSLLARHQIDAEAVRTAYAA